MNDNASKSKYKAFISYSHLEDSAKAEKIVAAIERYGLSRFRIKKRHQIFRDESHLPKGPPISHILDELEKSEYLIYLASERGQNSEWVRTELMRWIELGRQDKMIIILTNGVIASTPPPNPKIDWNQTNVIPKALSDHLHDVPYYSNLTWVTTENVPLEELTLSNSKFEKEIRTVVAQLEGGIQPDLLKNEARENAKKDLRILRTGIAALAIIFTIAVVFGIRASRSATEAIGNLELAQQNFEISEENRIEAEQNQSKYRKLSEANQLATSALRLSNSEPSRAFDSIQKALDILDTLSSPTILNIRGELTSQYLNEIIYKSPHLNSILEWGGNYTLKSRIYDDINQNVDIEDIDCISLSPDMKEMLFAVRDTAFVIDLTTKRIINQIYKAPSEVHEDWITRRIISATGFLSKNAYFITYSDGDITMYKNGLPTDSLTSEWPVNSAIALDSTTIVTALSLGVIQILHLKHRSSTEYASKESLAAINEVDRILNPKTKEDSANIPWFSMSPVWKLVDFREIDADTEGNIIVSDNNGRAYLFNKEKGYRSKTVPILKSHDYYQTSPIAFSPTNDYFAVGNNDGKLRLFDSNGHQFFRKSGHTSFMAAVAISFDGHLIATAGTDRTIRLWNRKGELVDILHQHRDAVNALKFSRDSTYTLFSAGDDGYIFKWRLDNFSELVSDLRSPISESYFSGDSIIVIGEDSSGVFELVNNTLIRINSNPQSKPNSSNQIFSKEYHQGRITQCFTSQDGRQITLGIDGKAVCLGPEETVLFECSVYPEQYTYAAFSDDYIVLAADNGLIEVRSIKGDLLASFADSESAGFCEIICAKSKNHFATLNRKNNSAKLWRTDGVLLQVLKAHLYPISSLGFLDDELYSIDEQGCIRRWQ